MTKCECPRAGYCPRHKINKNPHWHSLCQTHVAYFDRWEDGTGPGQRTPQKAIPKAVRPKGRVHSILKLISRCCGYKTKPKEVPMNGVGDVLHTWIKNMGINPEVGCDCPYYRNLYNSWGPDLCTKNIEEILDVFQTHAQARCLPFVRYLAGAREAPCPCRLSSRWR